MTKVGWENTGAEFRKVSQQYKGTEIQTKDHKEPSEDFEHRGGVR